MFKEQLIPLTNESGSTLQEGATSHTANHVKEWWNKNMAGFRTKELWPPSSTDLNLMDFGVWSILDSNACLSCHPSAMPLKAKLKHCWDKISPETIRVSCNQVTDKLRCVVEAKGGYIKNYISFTYNYIQLFLQKFPSTFHFL